MYKSFLCIFILTLSLNAFDFRAYDIGGNEIGAKTSTLIEGEEYTLLPFSYLDIKKDNINRDGDFTLLFGKINGKEVEPLKVASNYKFQPIIIKVFKSNSEFNENTFITKSEELFIDNDVIFFSIDVLKD